MTLLALVAIGGTVLSWFYYYGGGCTVVDPYENDGWGRWSRYSLMAAEGRVWISQTPACSSCWGSPPSESSSRLSFYKPDPFYKEIGLYWGSNPFLGTQTIGSTNGTEYQTYFSGFLPGGFFGLLAAWSWCGAWKRRRLSRQGCCSGCGYSLEGLGEGVCPECGEE